MELDFSVRRPMTMGRKVLFALLITCVIIAAMLLVFGTTMASMAAGGAMIVLAGLVEGFDYSMEFYFSKEARKIRKERRIKREEEDKMIEEYLLHRDTPLYSL